MDIATEITTNTPAPKARKPVAKKAKAPVKAGKKTKLRLIGEFTYRRWVPRKEICKKFGIVDHTARHYIGRLAHTPGYDVEYRKGEGNHGEYRTNKLAALTAK